MKTLSDYTESAISSATKKHGAFFAFGVKQLKEQMDPNIPTSEYFNLGGGLIVPKKNADALSKDLEDAYLNGIAQDIKENGMENIIKRELDNHEAYYTYDMENTISALRGYKFPDLEENVSKIFHKEKENYLDD